MSNQARTTSDLLDTAERRAFVLRLRKGGATYQEIATAALREFGADALPQTWDERYAHKDVRRELDKLRNEIGEAAEDVRALELQRLDDLLKAAWPKAAQREPDWKAFDRVLKLMERRAKLVGLDAPAEFDVKSGGKPIVITDIIVEHPQSSEPVEN